MNGLGNEMMAAGVLKTFGLTVAQIAAAKETWMDLPNSAPITIKTALTVRQYLQLRTVAVGQGKSVEDMLGADVVQDAQSKAGAAAPTAPAKP